MSKSKIHHEASASQAEQLVQGMEADGFGALFDAMKDVFGEAGMMEMVKSVTGREVDGYTYRVHPLRDATVVVLDGREVRICGEVCIVTDTEGMPMIGFRNMREDACFDLSVVEQGSLEDVAKELAACGLDVEPGMEAHVGRCVKAMYADMAFSTAGFAVKAD